MYKEGKRENLEIGQEKETEAGPDGILWARVKHLNFTPPELESH